MTQQEYDQRYAEQYRDEARGFLLFWTLVPIGLVLLMVLSALLA